LEIKAPGVVFCFVGEDVFFSFIVKRAPGGGGVPGEMVRGGGGGGGLEGTRGTLNEAHQLVPRKQNYSVFTKATIFKFFESKNKHYILKTISIYLQSKLQKFSLLNDGKAVY